MLRKWNVVLVVVTFLLSIFGTFITRSGVIESVHSFAQSPVGSWFGAFFFLATGTTIYLVATRLKNLEAKAELESMVSREAAFLYNNLVLVGIAFAVLWGTLFPILSEWVRAEKITVGPPFFNAVNIPLGLLLLALTGIGPLIAWRKASTANLKRQFAVPAATGVVLGALLLALGMRNGHALVTYTLAGFVTGTILQEFYKGVNARRAIHGENIATGFVRLVARNRRRYGGYIVHAGIVMLFAAFAGLAFRTEHDITLRTAQSFETDDPYGHHWRFVSQGASTDKRANREVMSVALQTFLDGRPAGFIQSEKRQYFDSANRPTFEPATEVGIRTTAKLDTYVVIAGVRGDVAELRVTFNPLVVWVWIGGALMAIGGLVVMWPQAQRRRVPEGGYVSVLAPARADAVPAGASV
jgi:cytochrome c-type biogenesis protein CcmF